MRDLKLVWGGALVALATGGTGSALAQTEPEHLETVVVVGRTTDWTIDDLALTKVQALDLEDIFRFDPSVAVGGALGVAQKIYVRGLEDTYLHVTVDGAPQTSTLFHHTGRIGVEPELLEQVEVQAGAGEATSGPGALGGAIRFVTKDADDLLEPNRRFGALLKGGYFSNADGFKSSVNVFGRLTDNVNALATFVALDQDDMEDGRGDPIPSSGTEQRVGFFKINADVSDAQTVSLSHESRKEEGEFGRRPDQVTAGDVLYPTTAERQTTIYNYSLAPQGSNLLNLHATLYHTKAELRQDTSLAPNPRQNWGVYGGEVLSQGFDLRNLFELGAHRVTVGADYRIDEVESAYLSPRAVWDWIYADEPDATGRFEEDGSVRGIYVQDHYQASEGLLLSFGGRYDWYTFDRDALEIDRDGFSGNVGLEYSLTDHWRVNLGYAEALRGKQVGDAFTLEAAAIDPELDAEEADNAEFGLTYNRQRFLGSATVYRARLDNVVHDQVGQGTFYENVGRLETEGFELKAAYQGAWLYIGLAYNEQEAELNGAPIDAYEHRGIGNSIGDTLIANLIFTLSEQLELGISGRHVAAMEDLPVLARSAGLGWTDPGQTLDKPSYSVFDTYLQWEPINALQLTLTVQNVFDRFYRDHASVGDYSGFPPAGDWVDIVGVPEPGRDVRVSVSYQF